MRFVAAALSSCFLTACWQSPPSPTSPPVQAATPAKFNRIRVGNGQWVDCATRTVEHCGVVFTACGNGHEYLCITGVDNQLVDMNTPMPQPAAPQGGK